MKKIFFIIFLAFSFNAFSQENEDSEDLMHLFTYIDVPLVEQREVFTAEDIEEQHIEDLPDLIENAGIQVLSYGTYGLEQKASIRGFTDETVRVVVDGVCMNNPQTGTFDFSSIDIASVEKVEIVRGGFTEGVEDESAVGGVIYITTKKQSLGHSVSVDSSIKSFGNMKTSPLSIDSSFNKINYSGQLAENSFLKVNGSFSYAQNRFLYENSKGTISTEKNALVKDASGGFQFSQYYGNGNSVCVSDTVYWGNKKCPGTEYSKNIGLLKDLNNFAKVSFYNPELSGLLNVHNNFSYYKCRRNYDDNYGPSEHNLDDFKYSSTADLFRTKKARESVGLSLNYTYLDSTNSGVHYQLSGVFKQTTRIFFNDTFSMVVPLGFKFCGYNTAFVPKLGFAWEFKYLDILADGYRMIQFPNMDDLYWEGAGYSGNPDLECEKGWGTDLTFNVKQKILPFSVEFFWNYYEDKICWSGNTTKNEKSAFYFGIDLNVKRSFLNDRLIFKLSGEYLYNRLMNKADKLTYGKRIMWTPDFTGSFIMLVNLKKVDFNVGVNYMGKRYLSNLNTTYLEPYVLLNGAVNFNFFDNVKPYIRLENILNTRYQSIEGYVMPGASVTVGVNCSWKK